MKKLNLLIVLITLVAFSAQPIDCFAKKKKKPKTLTKLEDKADKMNRKGGFATVGIAVSDESRLDLGRTKAQQDALQKMAQRKEQYVETTIHDFREQIGVGDGDEINDVFRSLTDVVSATILKGAQIAEFEMSQEKANKKDGTATYYVLLVISPKYTYQSVVNEMEKGSDQTLYQRYVDSEAQKIHDEKIKQFKEEFGVEK